MNNTISNTIFDTHSSEIMTNNFDDIKQSMFFSELASQWSNFGFTQGIDGEKKDNLCIAFSQMVIFLMGNPKDTLNEIQNNLKYDVLVDFHDSTCKTFQEFFEVIIFPIIKKIYHVLPLSDYDYLEILDALKTIDVDVETVKTLGENEHDKPAFYATYISDKIINLINSK